MLIEKSRLPIKEVLLYGLLPSPLKAMVYRLKGARIGRNVSFGLGSVLIGDDVEVGDGTHLGLLSIVRARKIKLGRHVKIGSTTIIDTERVEIDDDAKINEQVFVGGPVLPESSLKVGKRTIIMQMSFINPTKPIEIGDDTGIGGHCLLFTHGSWQPQTDGYPVTFAPIKLGRNVWLPWRVFIMPGVTIGDGATIGANSLVNRDIPESALAAGSPAKVLKEGDAWPRRLRLDEKDRMLRSMLEEYIGYLRHNGVGVDVDEVEHGLVARIVRGSRRFSRRRTAFVLEYAGPEGGAPSPEVLSPGGIHLSLAGIAAEDARRLDAAGAMRVDLEKKTRKGTNDAGEETVLFLSRYGLRFDRLD